MSQSTLTSTSTQTRPAHWKLPVRTLHWLIAASMAGAVILTSQGDNGHATLGWLALGAVLAGQFILSKVYAPSPTLWLVAAVLGMLNLSGLLAPYGSWHLGTTLAALVIAALYSATVLFESLQCVTCVLPFQLRPARFRADTRTTHRQ